MSEHSTDSWKVKVLQEETSTGTKIWVLRHDRGHDLVYPDELVADVGPFKGCEAIARRLAACWNFCRGLSTEALERGSVLDGR